MRLVSYAVLAISVLAFGVLGPAPTGSPNAPGRAAQAASRPLGAAGIGSKVLTFRARHDATISADAPATNFGSATNLAVDGRPRTQFVVKFAVSGVNGRNVIAATLRLYATDGSDRGGKFYRLARNRWFENTVTWNNAPPSAPGVVASLGGVSAGEWQEVDVTSQVTGNGVISFRATSSSENGAQYSSHEGSFAPELLVTIEVPAVGPVIGTAGDIACGKDRKHACKEMETSDILLDMDVDAVLPLGDTQYQEGEYEDFIAYYDPSWGRLIDRTYPVVGNHEYLTPGAEGYFDYFEERGRPTGGRDKGYYAFNVDNWRIYVLNSNCSKVGGAEGSQQEQWLRADLAANPRRCTMLAMHHPMVTSDRHENFDDPRVKPLWQAFYEAGGEIILVGHAHNYERFARLNPDLQPDPTYGIRQFIVGTGGRSAESFGTIEPSSEARDSDTLGVIAIVLARGKYEWRFVPIAGQTFTDSGSESCHAAPPAG